MIPTSLCSIFAILFGQKEDLARVRAAHTGNVAYIRSSSGDAILLLMEDCLGRSDDQGKTDIYPAKHF